MSSRDDAAPEVDAYAVLQVQPHASDATILAAYRGLARRHHPDKAGAGATRRMAAINAAFELIRTPARRQAYDAVRRRLNDPRILWRSPRPDGTGAAGPAPGRPSGSVLDFGRHIGWSIGEIARVDPGYLEWLEDRPEGKALAEEIDATLLAVGWRRPIRFAARAPRRRRGLFARG